MTKPLWLTIAAVAFLAASLNTHAETKPLPKDVTRVPVNFSGGHETDPRDHGRSVVLVASALGVTSEVFRAAFSNVHPAGPGSGGPSQVRGLRAVVKINQHQRATVSEKYFHCSDYHFLD